MESSPTATNRFEIVVDAHLDERQKSFINRWLNLQYDGRELIPLDVKCSQEHQDASWAACACRRFTLTI